MGCRQRDLDDRTRHNDQQHTCIPAEEQQTEHQLSMRSSKSMKSNMILHKEVNHREEHERKHA